MKFIACIILAFISNAGLAQQNKEQFPVTFMGTWRGSLEWIIPGKSKQVFSMQLTVSSTPAGLYNWEIKYGDSNMDTRPYLLKPVDAGKGHWLIDEQNGIVLDNYVAGNCLQGSFTVMKNTIVNNYCIEDGKMSVEFFTIRLEEKKTVGKGTEDSPTVDSYRMAGYQYGLLEKVR